MAEAASNHQLICKHCKRSYSLENRTPYPERHICPDCLSDRPSPEGEDVSLINNSCDSIRSKSDCNHLSTRESLVAEVGCARCHSLNAQQDLNAPRTLKSCANPSLCLCTRCIDNAINPSNNKIYLNLDTNDCKSRDLALLSQTPSPLPEMSQALKLSEARNPESLHTDAFTLEEQTASAEIGPLRLSDSAARCDGTVSINNSVPTNTEDLRVNMDEDNPEASEDDDGPPRNDDQQPLLPGRRRNIRCIVFVIVVILVVILAVFLVIWIVFFHPFALPGAGTTTTQSLISTHSISTKTSSTHKTSSTTTAQTTTTTPTTTRPNTTTPHTTTPTTTTPNTTTPTTTTLTTTTPTTTPTTTSKTTTTTTVKPSPFPTECLEATNYTENWRLDHNGGNKTPGGVHSKNGYACDFYAGSPWFRFSGAAGTSMMNSCIPQKSCGAYLPFWTDDQMPQAVGAAKSIKAYGSYTKCRAKIVNISVMRCSWNGNDFIYKYDDNPYDTCFYAFCGMV